jgi:hypothetical protein
VSGLFFLCVCVSASPIWMGDHFNSSLMLMMMVFDQKIEPDQSSHANWKGDESKTENKNVPNELCSFCAPKVYLTMMLWGNKKTFLEQPGQATQNNEVCACIHE